MSGAVVNKRKNVSPSRTTNIAIHSTQQIKRETLVHPGPLIIMLMKAELVSVLSFEG